MSKICNNCGTKNSNTSKFCESCGKELESNKTSNHKSIIFLLIGIVAILVIGIVVVSMGSTTTQTVTTDFGGITMLIPEGSNFVESNSLPNYGYNIGGFIIFENGGEHKDKVNSIMFSTIKANTPPSEVVLDRVEDGVSIYKDANGENMYYIQKDIGDYKVSLIGRDLQLMLKMINSVQINNPTLNI